MADLDLRTMSERLRDEKHKNVCKRYEELKEQYPDVKNKRWHAIKMLAQDKEICEKYPMEISDIVDRSYESDIIAEKYDFIETRRVEEKRRSKRREIRRVR